MKIQTLDRKYSESVLLRVYIRGIEISIELGLEEFVADIELLSDFVIIVSYIFFLAHCPTTNKGSLYADEVALLHGLNDKLIRIHGAVIFSKICVI